MFIRSSSKLRADIYGIQYTTQVCQTESNRSFEYAFIAFFWWGLHWKTPGKWRRTWTCIKASKRRRAPGSSFWEIGALPIPAFPVFLRFTGVPFPAILYNNCTAIRFFPPFAIARTFLVAPILQSAHLSTSQLRAVFSQRSSSHSFVSSWSRSFDDPSECPLLSLPRDFYFLFFANRI